MNNGWIKLHRKLLEWEWYDDANTFRLFIHCLLKANHTPKKWRGENIDKGQFITSLSNLSHETGLSIKQVRNSLDKLKNTNEINTEKGKAWTKISVCKYASYQRDDSDEGKERAKKGQGRGKVGATNKNDNNDNNEKNNSIEKQNVFPLQAREQNFISEVKTIGSSYNSDMINKFILYWTEKNPNGKKMRFEMQKVFDISRRLKTWAGKEFNKQPQQIRHETDF